jgi:hypothetical protein
MSATTTQLLSSGEFCKRRYDTIPVKSASANVSFYTSNSKISNFELWHSCRKWAIYSFARQNEADTNYVDSLKEIQVLRVSNKNLKHNYTMKYIILPYTIRNPNKVKYGKPQVRAWPWTWTVRGSDLPSATIWSSVPAWDISVASILKNNCVYFSKIINRSKNADLACCNLISKYDQTF